jgi:hypothetical protein
MAGERGTGGHPDHPRTRTCCKMNLFEDGSNDPE